MKNRYNLRLLLPNVLFLALMGTFSCSDEKDERQKLINGNIIPVKTITVEAQPMKQTISATGLLNTDHEARMAFKIGGVIDRILVEEGDQVKKGQLLAVLKVLEIEAQLEQAKLNVAKTKRDYERAERLHRDSVATLEQLENARTAFQLATRGQEQVAFNRQYAEIRAKSDGFVARKLANEGEVIGSGAPVFVISENSPTSGWVLRVGFSDREWVQVAVDQKATVTFDAYPGQTFEGEVIRKSQTAEQGTGTFQAEIGVSFMSETPASGMFGKAYIQSTQERVYPVIPLEALLEIDGFEGYVMVPTSATTVRKQAVTIAVFDSSKALIAKGLKSGDKVVLSNAAFLNEQSVVKIIQ